MSFSALFISSVTETFYRSGTDFKQQSFNHPRLPKRSYILYPYLSKDIKRFLTVAYKHMYLNSFHPDDVLFSLSKQNTLSASSSPAFLSSIIAGELLVNSQKLSLESGGRTMFVNVQIAQICTSSQSHNTLYLRYFPTYVLILPFQINYRISKKWIMFY